MRTWIGIVAALAGMACAGSDPEPPRDDELIPSTSEAVDTSGTSSTGEDTGTDPQLPPIEGFVDGCADISRAVPLEAGVFRLSLRGWSDAFALPSPDGPGGVPSGPDVAGRVTLGPGEFLIARAFGAQVYALSTCRAVPVAEEVTGPDDPLYVVNDSDETRAYTLVVDMRRAPGGPATLEFAYGALPADAVPDHCADVADPFLADRYWLSFEGATDDFDCGEVEGAADRVMPVDVPAGRQLEVLTAAPVCITGPCGGPVLAEVGAGEVPLRYANRSTTDERVHVVVAQASLSRRLADVVLQLGEPVAATGAPGDCAQAEAAPGLAPGPHVLDLSRGIDSPACSPDDPLARVPIDVPARSYTVVDLEDPLEPLWVDGCSEERACARGVSGDVVRGRRTSFLNDTDAPVRRYLGLQPTDVPLRVFVSEHPSSEVRRSAQCADVGAPITAPGRLRVALEGDAFTPGPSGCSFLEGADAVVPVLVPAGHELVVTPPGGVRSHLLEACASTDPCGPVTTRFLNPGPDPVLRYLVLDSGAGVPGVAEVEIAFEPGETWPGEAICDDAVAALPAPKWAGSWSDSPGSRRVECGEEEFDLATFASVTVAPGERLTLTGEHVEAAAILLGCRGSCVAGSELEGWTATPVSYVNEGTAPQDVIVGLARDFRNGSFALEVEAEPAQPLPAGDTCAEAEKLPAAPAGRYYVDTVPLADDVQAPECYRQERWGPDAIVPIEVPAAHELVWRAYGPWRPDSSFRAGFDGYLLTDCADNSTCGFVTEGPSGGVREGRWMNDASKPLRRYLAVDSYLDGGWYSVEWSLVARTRVAVSAACDREAKALGTGVHAVYGDLAEAEFAGPSTDGPCGLRAGAVAVRVAPGEQVVATRAGAPVPVVTACDDLDACPVFDDGWRDGRVNHGAEAETWFVLVDASTEAGPFTLDVEIGPAQSSGFVSAGSGVP